VRRKTEILQNDRRLVAPQRRDGARAGVGRLHLVTVATPTELLLQPRVVFDDQQLWTVLGHALSSLGGAAPGYLSSMIQGATHGYCEMGSGSSRDGGRAARQSERNARAHAGLAAYVDAASEARDVF